MTSKTDSNNARQQRIVSTAKGVFLLYGFTRTTMADIAQAAGLTRPTLYLSFPDKESIFNAVIRALVCTTINDLRQGLATRESLEDKLTFVCEAWALGSFQLIHQYPNAKDFFDLSFLPVRESYDAFDSLLVEIIQPYLAESELAIDVHIFAGTISSAIKGFRDMAADNQQICAFIHTLTATIGAALKNKQG